jgi:CRP/FNR family cyclic AMP-dependent transcriptional regulator
MTRNQPELLHGLTPNAAAAVSALGAAVHVAGGSELFHIGAQADHVFVVERGRISLSLPMHVGGREQNVLIEERMPGQAVGWSALVPPHRFTLNAAATHDAEVLAIPRVALLDYLAAHPEVGFLVMRNVAEIVGQRLQVVQAMWLREMQRVVEMRAAAPRGAA